MVVSYLLTSMSSPHDLSVKWDRKKDVYPAAEESCSIFYNVKPILSDRVNSKASMPERDFTKFDVYCKMQMRFYSQSNVNKGLNQFFISRDRV